MIFIYKCNACVSRYYAISEGMSIKCPQCGSKEREHVGDMDKVKLINLLIQWTMPDQMEQLFSSKNLFPKKKKKST